MCSIVVSKVGVPNTRYSKLDTVMVGTALEIDSTEPSGVSRRTDKRTDYGEIGCLTMLSAVFTASHSFDVQRGDKLQRVTS